MDAARSSASVSPYQSLGDLGPRSLGDRPEMELDLWEGQAGRGEGAAVELLALPRPPGWPVDGGGILEFLVLSWVL